MIINTIPYGAEIFLCKFSCFSMFFLGFFVLCGTGRAVVEQIYDGSITYCNMDEERIIYIEKNIMTGVFVNAHVAKLA